MDVNGKKLDKKCANNRKCPAGYHGSCSEPDCTPQEWVSKSAKKPMTSSLRSKLSMTSLSHFFQIPQSETLWFNTSINIYNLVLNEISMASGPQKYGPQQVFDELAIHGLIDQNLVQNWPNVICSTSVVVLKPEVHFRKTGSSTHRSRCFWKWEFYFHFLIKSKLSILSL